LIVSTLIDARTFLIPAPITNFMTGVALVGWLVQGLLVPRPMVEGFWPIPTVGWPVVGLSIGALLGLMLAGWCLHRGIIARSFLDYEDYVEEGETLGEYPHARREMGKELLFLLPILLGGLIGGMLTLWIGPEMGVPRWLMAISASVFGALVGGGLVWGVRILGTLAFGREAMGMGDVHLLVAVGAALGWIDPIKAFFIAPFTALAWVFLSRIVTVFSRKAGRELPYGPHLAFATMLVIFLRPVVDMVQHELFHPLP
jgi:leader peptidase (prepilin peptidase)/N-methyltransferase